MKTSTWCVCVLLLVGTTVEGKRFGGGGGSRRGGSTYKHRTPSPPPPPPPSHTSSHGSGSSGTFLNAERAGSPGGTTHNRGSPFSNPPPPQTNGPVGFERFGGAGTSGGSHQIGFDKVNSQAQNKPNSYNPSAPPGPVGPPPAYPGSHSTGNFGGNDHPPAYPGRPINAPPSYTPTNQHFQGQQFGNGVPHQNQFGNPSHGNPGYGNPSYGNPSYGNPSYGNPSYGNPSYGNPGFGNPNYGSYQGFGSPTYGGGTFGGGYHSNNYQGNSYGGSPFGGGGYNGNPYYSPNNFGYSNNPGYFGGGGYPGQYDYHKKSRFGGLPIPIPIPIPIPFGGGFGGGFGGLGGYHSHSYNHRVLDTFIKDSNTSSSGNSSTSVFLLNNATVTPCTTDHFVYDTVKVTTMACTALSCTAVKVLTRTNVSAVETVHGGSVTLCLEGGNATVSSHGEIITPVVSEIKRESLTVCRNVTAATNKTSEEATTTAEPATTTFAPETTTVEVTSTASVSSGNTTVCEVVNCSSVEMCLPAVELVDACTAESCPFRRTGYKPCVVVKMCSAPSAPVSTFATLNTTISKIDEYNRHQSVNDVANLTLISYHPPVTTSFNTSTTSFNTSSTSFNTSTTTPAP